MRLESIISEKVLNIFCDASTENTVGKVGKGSRSEVTTCGGFIAISGGKIKEEVYHHMNYGSSGVAEIDAFESAIYYGLNNDQFFDRINIFTDYQPAVSGIRTWEAYYKYHPVDLSPTHCDINKYDRLVLDMIGNGSNNISIYHQKSHVKYWLDGHLRAAAHVFAASNGIRNNIDLSLIKYISRWNTYIDNATRGLLGFVNESPLMWNDTLEFKLTRRDEIYAWMYPLIDQFHKNMYL